MGTRPETHMAIRVQRSGLQPQTATTHQRNTPPNLRQPKKLRTPKPRISRMESYLLAFNARLTQKLQTGPTPPNRIKYAQRRCRRPSWWCLPTCGTYPRCRGQRQLTKQSRDSVARPNRTERASALGYASRHLGLVVVDAKPARSWALQFLIRRCAWHMLDHAWELEDRDLTANQ